MRSMTDDRRKAVTAARAKRARQRRRLEATSVGIGCFAVCCYVAFWGFVVATVVYAALHFVWGM